MQSALWSTLECIDCKSGKKCECTRGPSPQRSRESRVSLDAERDHTAIHTPFESSAPLRVTRLPTLLAQSSSSAPRELLCPTFPDKANPTKPRWDSSSDPGQRRTSKSSTSRTRNKGPRGTNDQPVSLSPSRCHADLKVLGISERTRRRTRRRSRSTRLGELANAHSHVGPTCSRGMRQDREGASAKWP